MKLKKLIIIMGIVGSFLVLSGEKTFAEGINYSVKANIPENQIDTSKSYFDLKVLPDQEQALSLTVKNTSQQPITVNVTPTNATTNQNGVIDYSKRDIKNDSSLVYPFTTLIDKEQKVTLQADESKEVIFNLHMPKESFNGTILGGFSISEDTGSNKDEKSSEGVQIKNEYSFVIGASLKMSEETLIPNIQLNDVKPMLLNYRTAVSLNLQNTEATIINGLKVDASISKKGSTEVLHKESKESLSMAPNSNFDFPVSWSNNELKAGEYEATVDASAGDEKWSFKKTFTISDKESKSLNEEAVEVKTTKNYTWLVILISLIGVGLAISIILFLRYKKRKKELIRKARIKAKKKRKAEIRSKKSKQKRLNKNKDTEA